MARARLLSMDSLAEHRDRIQTQDAGWFMNRMDHGVCSRPCDSLQWNFGGAEGDRTPDLVIANDALSHLSYGPVPVFRRSLPMAPSRVTRTIREARP